MMSSLIGSVVTGGGALLALAAIGAAGVGAMPTHEHGVGGMGIVAEDVEYRVGDRTYRGYLAFDASVEGKRPAVAVVHEWWGLNEHARDRVRALAAQGYTAMALDMYGVDRRADNPTDAQAYMAEAMADPAQLEARFNAGLGVLKAHASADAGNVAAVGYCFGGGVVLHMARRGADLKAVATLHGLLPSEHRAKPGEIKAPLAVFTGSDDPFVPHDQVLAFVDEMQKSQAHLYLRLFPGVRHSFTNPDATAAGEKFALPLAYDRAADAESWARVSGFLAQSLGHTPRVSPAAQVGR